MATITTPAFTLQQGQKLARGMGLRYGLKDAQDQPRDATPEEMGQFALDWLRYAAREAIRAKARADADTEPPI
jgi:hypothetical protein